MSYLALVLRGAGAEYRERVENTCLMDDVVVVARLLCPWSVQCQCLDVARIDIFAWVLCGLN